MQTNKKEPKIKDIVKLTVRSTGGLPEEKIGRYNGYLMMILGSPIY